MALNTLIFVGLTVAKVFRWPHQTDPVAFRRHLRIHDAGFERQLSAAIKTDLEGNLNVTLIATASVWLAVTSAGVAFTEFLDGRTLVPELAAGSLAIASLVFAMNLYRRETPEKVAMWLWCALISGFTILLLAIAASSGEAVRFGYSIVIMAAYPIVLTLWWPFVASSAALLGGLVVSTYVTDRTGDLQLLTTGVTAVIAGTFIVAVRRKLASHQSTRLQASLALGLKDPSSAAWSPEGLSTLAPFVIKAARESQATLRCKIVSLAGFDRRVDAFGYQYGEQLMRALTEHLGRVDPHATMVARISRNTAIALYMSPDPLPLPMEALSNNVELGHPRVEVQEKDVIVPNDAESIWEILAQTGQA